jgi:hypothetical protein
MRMVHATSVAALPSIKAKGLCAKCSEGVKLTVCLVAEGMTGAAIAHTMKRHNLPADQVAVLEVDVPRSWLRKGKRKGLWHTGGRDIPPERIKAGTVLVRFTR